MSWKDFFRDWIRRHFPRSKKQVKSRRRNRLEKDVLGNMGEKQAARFLRKRGYKILEKNVTYDDGELDIVARHENMLVVIEVKTRRPYHGLHPSLAVDLSKQRKIKRLAFRFLRQRKLSLPVRFDVVAITWPKNQPPQIEHFIDAFR